MRGYESFDPAARPVYGRVAHEYAQWCEAKVNERGYEDDRVDMTGREILVAMEGMEP